MMLTLAEFAASNRDGTYTVLRGGIDRWHAPALPVHPELSVFVDCPPGEIPGGAHEFLVTITRLEPTELEIDRIGGRLVVRRPELATRFSVRVQVSAQQYGPLVYRVAILGAGQAPIASAEIMLKIQPEPLE